MEKNATVLPSSSSAKARWRLSRDCAGFADEVSPRLCRWKGGQRHFPKIRTIAGWRKRALLQIRESKLARYHKMLARGRPTRLVLPEIPGRRRHRVPPSSGITVPMCGGYVRARPQPPQGTKGLGRHRVFGCPYRVVRRPKLGRTCFGVNTPTAPT